MSVKTQTHTTIQYHSLQNSLVTCNTNTVQHTARQHNATQCKTLPCLIYVPIRHVAWLSITLRNPTLRCSTSRHVTWGCCPRYLHHSTRHDYQQYCLIIVNNNLYRKILTDLTNSNNNRSAKEYDNYRFAFVSFSLFTALFSHVSLSFHLSLFIFVSLLRSLMSFSLFTTRSIFSSLSPFTLSSQ